MKLRNKKTGDIGDFLLVMQDDDIKLWSITNCYETYHYKSLLDFNNDWEGCEPAEPLIKDEKVRKAVRAWAEANGYPKTMELYYNAPNFVLRSDMSTIEFDKEIEPLQHGEEHTIAELCGEEEE